MNRYDERKALEIAPGKTSQHWKELSGLLRKEPTQELWDQAITDFFKGRLDVRYIKPMRVLTENGSRRGEGFAIVTLQCALIEFLAAMRSGKRYEYGAKETDLVYGSSKKLFIEFLEQVRPFAAWFAGKGATNFYSSVRCGLLHEARTNGGWRIRFDGTPTIDAQNYIVYRESLRRALSAYVEAYVADVRREPAVQRAFISKFDDIAA